MKKEQNKSIDFSRFVSTDDLEESLDVFKGVHSLLESLEMSSGDGIGEYDSYAFKALQVAMKHGIKEIEALKPNIEYMGDFMREKEKGLRR